jgi:hypothetical protein
MGRKRKGMIQAWELSEGEFDMYVNQVSVKDIVGTYKSINGKAIEVKSNRREPAGMTYIYTYYVDGKRKKGSPVQIRKEIMELPDDYPYFIVYDLVRRYATEKFSYPPQMIY